MSTSEETEAAELEALLSSPAEAGDYDCSVPGEFAGGESEAPERPAQPIAATCSRQYSAVRRSGTRDVSQIGLIVIHCTQSNSASSSAQWFENPRAQGSAHLVVDENECYRTLDDNVIPWGAKGANTRGFHIEIVGWAEWSRADWMKRSQTLRRAAYKAAVHAVKFGIPIRWLSVAEAKAGKDGFVTHAICTKAFGGSHTDPGANYPAEQLLAWTTEYAEKLT
jgi:N-acetylmuramoyl-L-alanine amidase